MAKESKLSRVAKPKPTKGIRTYHHGDLRNALLEAARTLLVRGGPSDLTLRAVAREAGVSEAAPYRHFTNRDRLVEAVALHTSHRLTVFLAEVVASTPSKLLLEEIAARYVDFALASPSEYIVMFEVGARRRNAQQQASTADTDASLLVIRALQTHIERLQETGAIRAGDSGTMAFATWALLHGVVLFTLSRPRTQSRNKVFEGVRAATSLLISGMAPPSAGVVP